MPYTPGLRSARATAAVSTPTGASGPRVASSQTKAAKNARMARDSPRLRLLGFMGYGSAFCVECCGCLDLIGGVARHALLQRRRQLVEAVAYVFHAFGIERDLVEVSMHRKAQLPEFQWQFGAECGG